MSEEIDAAQRAARNRERIEARRQERRERFGENHRRALSAFEEEELTTPAWTQAEQDDMFNDMLEPLGYRGRRAVIGVIFAVFMFGAVGTLIFAAYAVLTG